MASTLDSQRLTEEEQQEITERLGEVSTMFGPLVEKFCLEYIDFNLTNMFFCYVLTLDFQ